MGVQQQKQENENIREIFCFDFSIKMDFLKAEIERKKRQLTEKNVVGPNKKYFKRGELMEKEREEYFKKLKPKEEDVKYVAEINQPKENDDKKRSSRQFRSAYFTSRRSHSSFKRTFRTNFTLW